jgi:UDP-glucose 4-epimerase
MKESIITKSNVAITGGNGFIGSHLVNHIINLRPKKLTIIDTTEKPLIQRIRDPAVRIKFILTDLSENNQQSLDNSLRDVSFLFHLAALKEQSKSLTPEKILINNIKSTVNICEAAIRNKVKKIIFASSVKVYGRGNRHLLRKNDPLRPNSLYGISKLCGEHLIDFYARKNAFTYAIIRYFFVYGPGQKNTVIVNNFKRILQNKPPFINGSGKQILDYIYIDDAILMTVAAMEKELHSKIINIGSGNPISINKLTKVMLKTAKKKFSHILRPEDNTAGSYRVANMKKTIKILGIKPNTSLNDGLCKTFDWIRNNK